MSGTPSILSPIITQLGVGGVGGLCVGYAIKKIAKIVAVIIGLAFLGLEYLAYQGIISINYGALEDWASNLVQGTGAIEKTLIAILSNLPFASSFLVGLAMGLKLG
jgi:uncharacterized membrane protein (Fun14 family)